MNRHDITPQAPSAKRWRSVLDSSTSVVLMAVALYVGWQYVTEVLEPVAGGIAIPADPLVVAGAAHKGSADAPVVMIEFSDFECPYCARFTATILPGLEREYIVPGKVALVFRHLPLPFHRNAALAGAAAECAGGQNQFWLMHDRLFERGVKGVGRPELLQLAGVIGLDLAQFDTCLDTDGATRVAEDTALAATLEITGTPGFLIGRRLPDGRVSILRTLSGTRPAEEFRTALNATLTAHQWVVFGRALAIAGGILLVVGSVVVTIRSVRRRHTAVPPAPAESAGGLAIRQQPD